MRHSLHDSIYFIFLLERSGIDGGINWGFVESEKSCLKEEEN